ncbi:sigma-70 family RNA polymerase sigma factor [Sporosarcina sp. OR05]|uniref:sigma-70 family RNA polymerase sigma factor n=1 Tax=Sporosarcina sp. OR05 TaxID=2969819 RepID=UPI00352A175F
MENVAIAKENKLIESFLSEKEHEGIHKDYINEPSKENKDKLEKAFKQYYKIVRAISYFEKVIRFESKHIDRRLRTHNQRYQLILDKQVDVDNESNVIDLLVSKNNENNIHEETNSTHLEDHIHDYRILNSLKNLTERQKQILYLSFVQDLMDKEISKELNISPQAVSKSKNKALSKVRRYLDVG